jgi:serine/threonine protein phosphatase PrpC
MNTLSTFPLHALHLSCAEVCDRGDREVNQDRIRAARRGALACFVVADGAGGHKGGETAAALVTDAVLDAFSARPGASTADLTGYADAASAAVARAQAATASLAAMSSTLAAVVIDQAAATAAWGHLGDSRIYLFRDGAVLFASVDHSLAQQLITAGLTAQASVRRHPQRHVLFGAIGAENGIDCAAGGAALLAGDALLLCSDGMWQWIDEDAMLAALPAGGHSQDWLDAMCAASADAASASTEGPRDNFSAYAICVHAGAAP